MDLSHIPLFAALNKRMSWINERQVVLAENVANVDTPGYKAQDLKPADFSKLVSATTGKLGMLVSDPGHLRPSSQIGGDYEMTKTEGQTTTTGNNVQLDEQAFKVSQNASDFSLMETLYRSQLSLVKMALGSGGSGGSSS
jgi:flagellar basal-body rod protein FlgB